MSASSTSSTLPNGGDSFGSTSDSIKYNAQSAADSIQSNVNSVQNNANAQASRLNSGPLVDSIKAEADKTSAEFSNLANSKTRPSKPAATGQPLTEYHSMLYTLLSWENPRATTIAFASTVAIIFMTRYINLLRYLFKFSYFVLGVTATLEIVGRLLFDSGMVSSMRPKKYYTIPKESLEPFLADIEEFLNFFVIEAQRILFAENVYATVAVFVSALLSYFLIRIMPFWGLSLLATSVMYLVPLVYVNNREAIDNSVQNFEHILNEQAAQIKDVTAHHASRATESVKAYATEYSHIAQQYMGQAQDSVNNAANQASASVNNAANQASASLNNAANQASASANNAANQASASVNNAANQAQASAKNAANQTSASINNAADQASTSVNNAATQASATANNVANQASSTADNIAYNMQESTQTSPGRYQPSGSSSTQPSVFTTTNTGRGSTYSSSDFPAVPRHEAENVADSIKPHDSETLPLLNH